MNNQKVGSNAIHKFTLWLDITLGVEAEYATVHHLARYRLKAKLKVPRPRNRKQDEEKLKALKKTLVMICN
ncbi:MAG: hypothetical protein V7L25_10275 [Nostoc sp.]|uniref:hypothetical protein n=1 Tax=Nostoc sp. TaxID=1180 RepID=UPI002FF0CAD4